MKRMQFWMYRGLAFLFGIIIMISGYGVRNALAAGKEIRIGVPLTYGPQNQPWQRGTAMLLKTLAGRHVKIVAMRGVPSGQSERSIFRRLIQEHVNAFPIGIYSNRSESIPIVREAHKAGIKTVGWITYAVHSPAVMEDAWGIALKLSHELLEHTGGVGGVVYTAESPGFYPPFDKMVKFLQAFLKFQPRMKDLGYVNGGVSTQDEIAISRHNFEAFFRAHPKKGSIKAIVSFWWPDTIGAIQAMNALGRNKEGIQVYNQYISKTLLKEMTRPDSPIVGTTNTNWRWIGKKLGNLLVDMAEGQKIPNKIFWDPVTWYPKAEAAKLLKRINKEDKWTHKELKRYGG